jgi:hypothetical protein
MSLPPMPTKTQWFTAARTASLVAALALVAQSEWALAIAVGWPAWIAWAAPVALDAYVLAAITAHKDLGPSVVVSTASVFGSHAVYAAPTAWDGAVVNQGGNHLVWQLAAACSVVPLLVTWRVHHLRLAERVAEVITTVLPVEAAAAPQIEPVEAVEVQPVKPPARRVKPPTPRPATDAELADVIAAVLADKPAAGRPTVVAALKDAGYTPGNGQRLTDAIAAHKRHSIHAVTG